MTTNRAADNILLKAHRQNHLWPSLHSAVDVYCRRRMAKAGAYELIWRLIHVWESTIITVASASVAWVRHFDQTSLLYRDVRERLYGTSRDDAGNVVQAGLGALDGSIDKWIEILTVISKKTDTREGSFLNAASLFLRGSAEGPGKVDLGPFARIWERACDVPSNVPRKDATPVEAMRAVNSFRNRFAHVPFPYDWIGELQSHLESLTQSLFEIQPNPLRGNSIFAGSFCPPGCRIHGAALEEADQNSIDSSTTQYFWDVKGSKERWPAEPFVTCDEMLRPYVLTRLKNREGIWEYTRFLAESNAVVERENADFLQLLPCPTLIDYEQPVVDQSTQSTTPELAPTGEAAPSDPSSAPPGQESIPDPKAPDSPAGPTRPIRVGRSPWENSRDSEKRSEAHAYLHRREFGKAIQSWKDYLKEHPEYHVGWLRLGYAQREYGVEYAQAQDMPRALAALRESLASFAKAEKHNDPYYRADAKHQASKSDWRIYLNAPDANTRKTAIQAAHLAAKKAVEISDDSKFASWLEFLERFMESRSRTDSAIE